MRITALVKNTRASHEVSLRTDGTEQPLAVASAFGWTRWGSRRPVPWKGTP